jgi:hypothetical protein
MALAKKCFGSFDSQTRSKGQAYYSSGMVRDLAIGDSQITASVRGSNAESYAVELDLTDPAASEIVGRCSCPRYDDGFLCKHIWAVLLANDNNAEGITCARNSVRVLHDSLLNRSAGNETSSTSDKGSGRQTYSGSSLKVLAREASQLFDSKVTSTTSSAGNWRKRFAAISAKYQASPRQPVRESRANKRPSQLWYLLNVAASQSKETMLAVEFFQREPKKNGEWGKLKRCHIRPDSIPDLPSEEDRRLVEALIGNEPDEHADLSYGNSYYGSHYYSYRGFNRSWVRPAIYDWLLPQLAASGRFVWSLDSTLPLEEAQAVVLDSGPPWQSRLRLESDSSDECWRVVGDFVRGEESRSFETAVMILSNGLVLFADRLCRADIDRDAAWLSALRKGGPIKIPFKDRVTLVKELCKLPQATTVELPADLCARQELGEPRPRIEISSPPYP